VSDVHPNVYLTIQSIAFPQTWQQLFVTRFLLGFGIGPKSATIPIYAAESAPANIRGALVMVCLIAQDVLQSVS
jgi:MFS family permease